MSAPSLLIVDDEANPTSMLGSALRHHGFEVRRRIRQQGNTTPILFLIQTVRGVDYTMRRVANARS